MLAAPLRKERPPSNGGRGDGVCRATQLLACSLGRMLMAAGSTHCPGGGLQAVRGPQSARSVRLTLPAASKGFQGLLALRLDARTKVEGWGGGAGGCRHAAAMLLPCRPSPSMPHGLSCHSSASLQRSHWRLLDMAPCTPCACELLLLLGHARQPSRPCLAAGPQAGAGELSPAWGIALGQPS